LNYVEIFFHTLKFSAKKQKFFFNRKYFKKMKCPNKTKEATPKTSFFFQETTFYSKRKVYFRAVVGKNIINILILKGLSFFKQIFLLFY